MTINPLGTTTKNTLPMELRAKMVDLLNGRLAEVLDLQLQSKQAHWNVRGVNFIALHEMLDEYADDLKDYADLIAERAVQLGGIAKGSLQAVQDGSDLAAYPLRTLSWSEHISFLAGTTARVGDTIRRAIDTSDDAGDATTADIFTEVSRGLDEWLWKLEAHLAE